MWRSFVNNMLHEVSEVTILPVETLKWSSDNGSIGDSNFRHLFLWGIILFTIVWQLESRPISTRFTDNLRRSTENAWLTLSFHWSLFRIWISGSHRIGWIYSRILQAFSEVTWSRFAWCINEGTLSCSIAVLTLIPKNGDLGVLYNWCPVLLICVDLKIFSKVLTNRLKLHMAIVIHVDQTYCISEQNIFDNFLWTNKKILIEWIITLCLRLWKHLDLGNILCLVLSCTMTFIVCLG